MTQSYRNLIASGIVLQLAGSALMMFAAVRIYERRDF
jgi:hypothetical protein